MEEIKKLFKEKLDDVHAICFVGKSCDERLTSSQKYVLSNVISLFGQDIAENFVCMATFCDGGKVLLMNALKASTDY